QVSLLMILLLLGTICPARPGRNQRTGGLPGSLPRATVQGTPSLPACREERGAKRPQNTDRLPVSGRRPGFCRQGPPRPAEAGTPTRLASPARESESIPTAVGGCRTNRSLAEHAGDLFEQAAEEAALVGQRLLKGAAGVGGQFLLELAEQG